MVYTLKCRKCPPFIYVGETGNKFNVRVTQHKGVITRKETEHPVGEHFNLPGHSYSDMIPTAIEQVLPKGDRILRLARERLWINRYNAKDGGANKI